MRAVVDNDSLIVPWIEGQLENSVSLQPCVTIAIVNQGGLVVGGVAYNNYRHPNIEMTIATTTPKWCSRGVLAALFAYPFRQLACTRVTAITEVMNQPTRAFLCRLGFQEEGVLRKAFPGGIDAVVHGMLAEECRWLTAEEPMRRVA